MPFGWVAAAGATGGILGGLIQGDASKSAAGTQADATNRASQVQLQMFNQTQGNLAPYMQSGQMALGDINQLAGLGPGGNPLTAPLTKPFGMSDFQQSPAYQFNLEQGQNAINKASNARGNYYAPQTIQDLSKFSQGLASNEFQNAFSNYNQSQQNIWNRLFSLAGAGQNAAANLGGFSGQAAGQIGQNTIGAGNAQAAGQIGVGNAITGGLQNAYNAYLTQQILGNQQSPSYASMGYPVSNQGFQNYDPATGMTLF